MAPSPLLLAALTSGERLTEIVIHWYRTSAAGTQEHYFTTKLEDAIIVDIAQAPEAIVAEILAKLSR